MKGWSASNRAFAVFAVSLVAGLALAWPPLGLLGLSAVALLTSIALARQGRGDEA